MLDKFNQINLIEWQIQDTTKELIIKNSDEKENLLLKKENLLN